ncbi:MAG: hypothetical protein EBS72_13810 [Rhizobiales bacterium]|nr:hypothetical protein [Hyphomicrobiales bacterium]
MAKVGYIFAQTGTSVLAPGINSPEMMHTNFLLLSSGNTVQIDLQGITAATGYDQIVVCKSGSVDLANATLALTSTITPASGTVFTIIDNQDNAIPITGTFSGLAEGAVITLNGSTYQISYVGGTGNNDVTLTAANTPTFGTPTATADGFTVQISNYNGNFTYGGAATAGGTVTISNTGVVTVRGVAANTSSTATITTTRNGYANGSSQVTETSLKAANTPAFGTPTATADGYTVQISNYDANFTYGGTATAGGTVAISNTGLVTVSGVAANTSSTATITTIRAGYVNGSAQVTAISVNPADRPTISSAATLKGGKVGRPYVMTYATLRAALKVARGVSIVIQSVQSGAVQKWSGTAWVTVSTAANAPLTQRSVSAGDKIRWLPPAGVSGNRPAFRANAWNGSLYSAVTAQVTIKLTRMAWFRT